MKRIKESIRNPLYTVIRNCRLKYVVIFFFFNVGIVGNLFSEELTFREIGEAVGGLIETGKYNEATSKLQSYISTLKNPIPKAESYYILGYTYYTYLQDYNKALQAYENAINLKLTFGTDSEGLEYIRLAEASKGDLYCRIGQYDKAILAYQRVISNDPKGPKGIYGEVYTAKIQAIKIALSQLKQQQLTLKTHPPGEIAANAQFKMAELYRQDLNSPERAILEYQRFLRLYPDNERAAEAAWRIGNLYSNLLYKPDKAILAYQKVVENYPMSKLDAEAHFQVGRIYGEKLYRFKEALQIFLAMPSLYPTWKLPAVLYWQGVCYEKLEEYDEAISAFKEFISLYSIEAGDDDEPHWLQDIGMFGESGKDVKAQVEERIRKLEKSAPEVYRRKAESLYAKGKYTESLAIYRKLAASTNSEYSSMARDRLPIIELLAELQICREKLNQPATSPAVASMLYYRRGEIFETGLKDYQQAIKEYQKVSELYPKSGTAPKSLYRMAELQAQKLNDFYKADLTFKRLMKDYPESPYASQASYQLGELYRKQLKGANAIKYFQAALNYPGLSWYIGDGYNDSISDAAGFRIGQTYYHELHDLKAAAKAFQNFISKRQESPRLAAAHAFVGLINEEQGDYESAANSYQKALDITLQSEVQASIILAEFKPKNNNGQANSNQIAKYLKAKVSQLKKLTMK